METERCLICLGPPREPTVLPCGHSFCTGCVSELRSKGVSDVCPLCRAPLPPGPEKLFELAWRVKAKLRRTAETGGENDGTWAPLSESQEEEMDGAIVMFQEAMDQVSGALGEDRAHHTNLYRAHPFCTTPLPTGPHPSGRDGRLHLFMGPGGGDRLPAGDGGVQAWC